MSGENLIGRQFGLLAVLARVEKDGPESWLCVCSCGGRKEFTTAQLLNGTPSMNCGCYHRQYVEYIRQFEDKSEETMARVFPREYQVWKRLKGKGRLCQPWARRFLRFMREMGPCPLKDAVLSRPHKSRVYSRHNAVWGEQPPVPRRMVHYQGKTIPINEFTREVCIQRSWIDERWRGKGELDGDAVVLERARFLARRAARKRRRQQRIANSAERAREQAAAYNAPFIPQFMR